MLHSVVCMFFLCLMCGYIYICEGKNDIYRKAGNATLFSNFADSQQILKTRPVIELVVYATIVYATISSTMVVYATIDHTGRSKVRIGSDQPKICPVGKNLPGGGATDRLGVAGYTMVAKLFKTIHFISCPIFTIFPKDAFVSNLTQFLPSKSC